MAFSRTSRPGPRANAWQRTRNEQNLPFDGGWFVYLGYEVAAEIEPRLRLPAADAPYSAFALRIGNLAIHDLATDQVFAITEDGHRGTHESLIAKLQEAAGWPVADAAPLRMSSLQEDEPERFLAQVRAAKEHIAAGDIYQANLSRAWRIGWRPRVMRPACTAPCAPPIRPPSRRA